MLPGKSQAFIDEQPLWIANTKSTVQNSSLTMRKLLQIFLKQITFALDINWRQRTIHAPLQLAAPSLRCWSAKRKAVKIRFDMKAFVFQRKRDNDSKDPNPVHLLSHKSERDLVRLGIVGTVLELPDSVQASVRKR